MEIPKEIKDSVKDTVGYSESNDKESFIIGATVSFSKSENYYTPIIESLQKQVEHFKNQYELVTNDFKTVVKIFNKYNQ